MRWKLVTQVHRDFQKYRILDGHALSCDFLVKVLVTCLAETLFQHSGHNKTLAVIATAKYAELKTFSTRPARYA